MDKTNPVFPKNWPKSYRKIKKWKDLAVQENICPVCYHYSDRFQHDGVCQFCGYEVKAKAVCRTNEIKESKMEKDLSKGLRPSKQDKGEILFGTFEFRKTVGDENVSVRRGVKWYNAKGRYIAKPSDKKDKREQPIDIHHTEIYRFKDVPAKVLYYEHQKECETYAGLLKAMFDGYGAAFSENEYVTVIWFRLVK